VQRERNTAKETAEEHARLAAEVAQLKSQLEKVKKRKQSPNVVEPTPKRAKPSAAASREKTVVKVGFHHFEGLQFFDGFFVHRQFLHLKPKPDQCQMH
jgi:beta-phosphoglucomutase-like phosphatase (HAD superfamily)